MPPELSRYPEILIHTREAVRRRAGLIVPSIRTMDREAAERLCGGLSRGYYKLALLAYVVEADLAEFYGDLYRCARSQQCLLQLHAEDPSGIDWSSVTASDIRAIVSAMAVDDLGLARDISGIQSKRYVAPYDASDFFLFAIALRALLDGETRELPKTLADFDTAREGRREGAARVLRALADKDNAAFHDGLEQFQAEWKAAVMDDSYADVPGGARPGEESVCVQALALIRLARSLGLKVRPEYSLAPREILSFTGFVAPRDGYPVLS